MLFRKLKIYWLILLGTIIATKTEAQFTDLVAKTEKAIVQIFSYDEYGSPVSTGTGFFINNNGIGLTNLHVLDEAKFAYIRDSKGKVYPIESINRICKECDLAEFYVNTGSVKNEALTVVNQIPPKAADIFVIGNPEGFESTVSKGIISSIRENDGNKVLQITAPISPGSSGSPIMDMNGNVIAVATYQYKEGQNLNFGYWIGCRDKLVINDKYKLITNKDKNLFVLNEVGKKQNNLVLNSIEVNEKNTVLNMTYTNTTLAFANAFIFTSISDREKSFYIQDKETGKKYYAYDATIGMTAKDPTFLKLGESKKFKIYFPPIGQATKLDIYEGKETSDWSFPNIDLSNYKSLDFESKHFFNDFYYQTGLGMLCEREYGGAYVVLKDYAEKNPENDYAQNLAGIVSYILGNNLDALIHMNKALKMSPTNSNYYFNLYFLNNANNNPEEALKNISSAIQLDNDQPEYYQYRAALYMKKEYWDEALKDLNRFINSDREIPGYAYFQRAVCKFWTKDKSGCKDLDTAYGKVRRDEEKEKIAEWYKKFCR